MLFSSRAYIALKNGTNKQQDKWKEAPKKQVLLFVICGYHNIGDIMEKFKEYFVVFATGGIIYSLLEVIFRGFTHWTMTVTGGTALLIIYITNIKIKAKSLILRCLAGCAIITALEFAVGCVVNRGLNMQVWDYSDEKYNVLGQICPLFSALWFLLCIPATLLSFFLRRRLGKNG